VFENVGEVSGASWSSTLDSLAADDLRVMFAPQLLDRLGELLRQQNRLAAEITRTVRECDLTQASEHDGLTSMQSWLRGHARLSPAAAARLVGNGRALEHLPPRRPQRRSPCQRRHPPSRPTHRTPPRQGVATTG
jgi:hypothetical protein